MSHVTTRALLILAIAVGTTALAGCAPDIRRRPVELVALPPGDSVGIYRFSSDVTFTPAYVYSRTIRTGSEWKLIGRIPAGEVYRPAAGVFTIESAHVHEAGLVIWQNQLTGFYMLVEKSFVPIDPPIAVQLSQGVKQ